MSVYVGIRETYTCNVIPLNVNVTIAITALCCSNQDWFAPATRWRVSFHPSTSFQLSVKSFYS